jgi:GTP-binding protein HflX
LRGPGETQLETDRRLLGKRVKALKEKLARMQAQRAVQRRARARANVFSISLVGYTNAGKSTLFNRLTDARVRAADQLFATLDTTTRRIHSRNGTSIVLSDTVGFIRQLPHTLVAAFRATLEETVHADLLLHVVDASSHDREAQIDAVNQVLAEIGADSIPQLLVLIRSISQRSRRASRATNMVKSRAFGLAPNRGQGSSRYASHFKNTHLPRYRWPGTHAPRRHKIHRLGVLRFSCHRRHRR